MPSTIFPDWFQSVMILVFLLITIYLVIQQANEMKKIQERARKKSKIITVIDCGGEKQERPFREGDFVGATAGCREGVEGRITTIYAIEEKEEGKRS